MLALAGSVAVHACLILFSGIDVAQPASPKVRAPKFDPDALIELAELIEEPPPPEPPPVSEVPLLETTPQPEIEPEPEPAPEPETEPKPPDARKPVQRAKRNKPKPPVVKMPPESATESARVIEGSPVLADESTKGSSDRPEGAGGGILLNPRAASGGVRTRSRRLIPRAPVSGVAGPQAAFGPRPAIVAKKDPRAATFTALGFERRGGGWHYEDKTGACGKRPCFTASIAADGTISFKRKRGPGVSFPVIRMLRGAEDAGLLAGPVSILRVDMPVPGAAQAIAFRQYQLASKTRSLRMTMASEQLSKNLDAQLNRLVRQLRRQWSDTGVNIVERRRQILATWEGCARPQPSAKHSGRERDPELDAAVAAYRRAGDRCRLAVEHFVRRRLAVGTKEAFSNEELRRFNADRKVGTRFSPYARKSAVNPTSNPVVQ